MMATSSPKLLLCCLFLTVGLMLGCSGDGKVRIDGTATWNGQPIEKGYVEFQPVAAGQFASAEIVDGKFRLETTPGPRRVKVLAQRKIGEKPATERIPHPEPIWFQYLPPKFNTNSELEVDITADDPTLELALEGEELDPQAQEASEQRRMAQQGRQ